MSKPGHTRLTVARDRYLNHCRTRLSAKTVQCYGVTINAFINSVGDLYCENLRPDHVEGFLAGLLVDHTDSNRVHRSPIAAKSYNGYLSRLAPFTKWLAGRGMTKTDLMVNVSRIKEHRKVKTRLDSDQIWALLDAAANPRDRALIAVAVHTALRASEIRTLTVGDLDLDRGLLKVTVHKSRTADEMPLTALLADELRSWLAVYQREVLRSSGRMLRPDDYLIPGLKSLRFTTGFVEVDGLLRRATTAGGYEPTRACFKPHEIVKRALAKIGVPNDNEGVHTLRRSAARILFDRLVNERGHDGALRVVSAFLHHASTQTTEVYLGLTSETRVRDHFLTHEGLLGPRPSNAEVVGLR